MDYDSRIFKIFLDVQSGLPRQGPGDDENTLKALSLCRGLPEKPDIVDIGCGPGMQTVALAKATNANITAVDFNREYLKELQERAESESVSQFIKTLLQDMNELSFKPKSFDLVWAEGSAYIIGFKNALDAWKQLLKTGGFIALSELVWLRPDPPSEVVEFFGNEYPQMTDLESNIETLKNCGYEIMGHFTLPDSAWWDLYYTPLEAKLPALNEKYSRDNEALSIINATRREIEIRRLFSNWYGYEFFVGQKKG